MPKSAKKTTSGLNKKKQVKRVIVLGGFGLFILTYILFLNYTPRSTLQWEERAKGSPSLREYCQDSEQIYPPTSWKSQLPVFSPDGKYYIDVADFKLGRKKILKVFKADTQKEVGRYYSSYPSLKIYCWAEDSSGIYVADYERAGTGFGIFQRSSKIGPLKKLLVP